MNKPNKILEIVQTEWTRIRVKNPAYSMRAFSRRLRISQAALSGLLNGRLPLTRKTGLRILESLGVEPSLSRKLLKGLTDRHDPKLKGGVLRARDKFELLDMDSFQLISNWYYFAILSLAETEGFLDDAAWVADRLKIRVRDSRSALKRLERLELLVRDPATGKLKPTGKQFKTSSGVPNPLIRLQHLQGLELARNAMEGAAPFEACDFSAMTMAIDPAKLPEAKARIAAMRRELCAELETGTQVEVYRLSIQLFPVSFPVPNPSQQTTPLTPEPKETV